MALSDGKGRLPKVLVLSACLLITLSARANDLPETVQSYLRQHYPDWTLCPINRDAENYFKEAGWHGSPNYFTYDFDGDRVDDFALQIRYSKGSEKEEADLVLLARGSGFKEFVLAKRPSDPFHRSRYFIRPVLIGETITDHVGHPVRYSNNGIELVAFQEGSDVFFYKKHAFHKTHTLNLK
jgi:hypothetical protein